MAATRTLIHASSVDDTTKEQIEAIAAHRAIAGQIAIMPDVHAGSGCVIGFTGRFKDAVIPNVVGVDIGCGVVAYPIGVRDVDFAAFDQDCRRGIPLGMTAHQNDRFLKRYPSEYGKDAKHWSMELTDIFKENGQQRFVDPILQVGTLGSGNHAIEIDKNPDTGELYLFIHSGSRNAGLRVCNIFQERAAHLCEVMGTQVPKGLEYLPLEYGGSDYLHAMEVAQNYASINRRIMLMSMLKFFGLDYDPDLLIESVHNYIDTNTMMVRKGAISAEGREKVVIPMSMKRGIILGYGKGNKDYNNSAPHGAGRKHGRKEMFRKLEKGELSMDDYTKSMEGIFTTSVNAKTFDESDMSYKDSSDIMPFLEETVVIEQELVPVYNLKSA